MAIVIGGLAEFCVSIAVILSFNAALADNINQGIGSSVMTLSAPIVSVLSYCLLGELASRTQVFGIVIVVIGVAVVSTCGPKIETPHVQINPLPGVAVDIPEESVGASGMFLVVVYGVVGGALLSIELMANKWLMVKCGIYGNITGFFFLLIEGSVGTICLIVTTLLGGGVHRLDVAAFWFLMLAGAMAFSALILLNYAIAIGNAGVAVSIFNTNPSIQTILSSTFLKQIISNGQIVGVVISLLGACILSAGDMLINKLCSKKTDERKAQKQDLTSN